MGCKLCGRGIRRGVDCEYIELAGNVGEGVHGWGAESQGR